MKGKREFSELAMEVLDKKHPDVYNQAIMDFERNIARPADHCVKHVRLWRLHRSLDRQGFGLARQIQEDETGNPTSCVCHY